VLPPVPSAAPHSRGSASAVHQWSLAPARAPSRAQGGCRGSSNSSCRLTTAHCNMRAAATSIAAWRTATAAAVMSFVQLLLMQACCAAASFVNRLQLLRQYTCLHNSFLDRLPRPNVWCLRRALHTFAQPFCTMLRATFSCCWPFCRNREPNSLLPATSTV
jgi:hypothetical protein